MLSLVLCALLGPVVTEHDAVQVGGSWQVTFRIYEHDAVPVFKSSPQVSLQLQGELSNSRVPGHSVPVRFQLEGAYPKETAGLFRVPLRDKECQLEVAVDAPQLCTSIKGPFHQFQVRLGHLHNVYGDVDPLFGRIQVKGQLYGRDFQDTLTFEPTALFHPSTAAWQCFPEDRQDKSFFYSAPDSLLLSRAASQAYYRFPEQRVRYSTRMRLRFRYLIAPGTLCPCMARLQQYVDTPSSWRVVPDGEFQEELKSIGRWTQYTHVFTTTATTTTIALDIRLTGDEDVGDCWIDDVELTPASALANSRP